MINKLRDYNVCTINILFKNNAYYVYFGVLVLDEKHSRIRIMNDANTRQETGQATSLYQTISFGSVGKYIVGIFYLNI